MNSKFKPGETYKKYNSKCNRAIGKYKNRFRVNEHQHGKLKQPKQP